MHEKAVRCMQQGITVQTNWILGLHLLFRTWWNKTNLFEDESIITFTLWLRLATIKENKCLSSDVGLAVPALIKSSFRKLSYSRWELNGKTPWFSGASNFKVTVIWLGCEIPLCCTMKEDLWHVWWNNKHIASLHHNKHSCTEPGLKYYQELILNIKIMCLFWKRIYIKKAGYCSCFQLHLDLKVTPLFNCSECCWVWHKYEKLFFPGWNRWMQAVITTRLVYSKQLRSQERHVIHVQEKGMSNRDKRY